MKEVGKKGKGDKAELDHCHSTDVPGSYRGKGGNKQ